MAVNKEVKQEKERAPPGVATPPEGGWGWMIVAGCFLATICIRAVTRCVSVFFVEFQLHFERDYSTTAWIHSLIDSITMLCAPLGSFMENRLSCRATVILGGMLSSFGLVLSSFASSLEHLYVSLGILTGLGFALCYTPSIAMVGRYFNERKALAYGIAQSGVGIGTFILAPVVQLLIENYSWRGALLVLGGFVSNLCVCGAVMRPLQLRRGEREKNEGNPERDCTTKALYSKNAEWEPPKDEKTEAKQLQTKNLDVTQGLLIANGALRNTELEDSKLCPGNIALLSDVKMSECILFSNNLSKMKLVESNNLNNKAAGITETKMEDSKPTDTKASLPSVSLAPEPPVETKCSPRGRSCCPQSKEEFGFLLIPDFLMLAVSFLFLAYGCSAPVVYLVPYALSIGVEYTHAAFLMSIFGISGIVGNITFGWITDRSCLKKYRMLSYMVAISMEGLFCLFIPLLSSFPHLATFAVLYGYFDGAYVALIPVVTSDVVGPTYLSSALGVVYFLHAVPYLVSPPIGGWLVDRTGNYAATFLLSGASFLFCAVVLAAAMLVKRWRSNSAAGLCSSRPAAAQDVI